MGTVLIAIKDVLGGWRALGFAALFVLAAVFGFVEYHLANHYSAKLNDAVARQQVAAAQAIAAARTQERTWTNKLAEVSASYEAEKANVKAASDAVVAGLRAGTVQLQERWAGCATASLSGAAASAAGIDASIDDRTASAGRIVQATDQCDAQVAALQSILKAERSGVSP